MRSIGKLIVALLICTGSVAAQQIGRTRQLPSLELSMDLLALAGQCDNGYAGVDQNNVSWSRRPSPI